MIAHGFGFHLTMMKARIVHAGGANTGTVSTRRAATTNAAKYSSTAVDYIGRVTYCEDTRSDHSTNRCRHSADARARMRRGSLRGATGRLQPVQFEWEDEPQTRAVR